jgi:hypothetical protein
MLRMIVRYGVIAGLIVGIPLFTITLTLGDLGSPWGYVVGYLIMLVALSTIFIAVKRHRDVDLGGVIKFWPALGIGLAISFVAGIFYVLAWEAVLDLGHLDFANTYAQSMINAAKARGLTGDALAQAVAEAEQFRTSYANPLYRLPETFAEIFPVGVLVSLVSAGLLRSSRFLAARRV